MNPHAILTAREYQVAERIAWGASIKEVAVDLGISSKTVDNHLQHIYPKIECGKLNELSAWYFCTTFHISFDLSPIKRKLVSLALLCLFIPYQLMANDQLVRRASRLTSRITRTVRLRRNESNNTYHYDL